MYLHMHKVVESMWRVSVEYVRSTMEIRLLHLRDLFIVLLFLSSILYNNMF